MWLTSGLCLKLGLLLPDCGLLLHLLGSTLFLLLTVDIIPAHFKTSLSQTATVLQCCWSMTGWPAVTTSRNHRSKTYWLGLTHRPLQVTMWARVVVNCTQLVAVWLIQLLTLCPAPPTRRTCEGWHESTASTTARVPWERVVVMIFSPAGGVLNSKPKPPAKQRLSLACK